MRRLMLIVLPILLMPLSAGATEATTAGEVTEAPQCTAELVGELPELDLRPRESESLFCASGYDCPTGFCPFIHDTPPGQCINNCCVYDGCGQCTEHIDCGTGFWRCVGGCCEIS